MRVRCDPMVDRPSARLSETRNPSPPERLFDDLQLERRVGDGGERVATTQLVKVDVRLLEERVEREVLREQAELLPVGRTDQIAHP